MFLLALRPALTHGETKWLPWGYPGTPQPCSLRDGGSVPGMSCPRAPRADATARRRAWEAAAQDFSSLVEAGDEGAGLRPGIRLLVKKKKGEEQLEVARCFITSEVR